MSDQPEKKLNHKEKLFCEEFLKDLNGTKSAIRAGYSKKTADVKASQLLRLVKIQNYIAKLQEKRSKRTEITQDNVLKELARLAFSNVQDLYEKGGEYFINITDLDENTARAIKSIKTKKVYNAEESTRENKVFDDVTEIGMIDKVRPLELLMDHLGMKKNNSAVGVVFETDEDGKTVLKVEFV